MIELIKYKIGEKNKLILYLSIKANGTFPFHLPKVTYVDFFNNYE